MVCQQQQQAAWNRCQSRKHVKTSHPCPFDWLSLQYLQPILYRRYNNEHLQVRVSCRSMHQQPESAQNPKEEKKKQGGNYQPAAGRSFKLKFFSQACHFNIVNTQPVCAAQLFFFSSTGDAAPPLALTFLAALARECTYLPLACSPCKGSKRARGAASASQACSTCRCVPLPHGTGEGPLSKVGAPHRARDWKPAPVACGSCKPLSSFICTCKRCCFPFLQLGSSTRHARLTFLGGFNTSGCTIRM